MEPRADGPGGLGTPFRPQGLVLGDFLTGDRAGWEVDEACLPWHFNWGPEWVWVSRIMAPRDAHVLALGPVSVEPDMAMTLQMGVG